MILLLDNFDSFTYNLVDYFNQLGVSSRIIQNNESLESIKSIDYQGIVLSPGPGTPEKAGNLLKVIQFYQDKLPILGICLGHQAIGTFYGAELVKAIKPMHGKLSQVKLLKDYIFKDIPTEMTAVRYHSLKLINLSSDLEAIGWSKENEIMGIRHRSKNIRGLQFHPEAILTENGLSILNNWVVYNQVKS